MKRTASLSIIVAGLVASMAQGQQTSPSRPTLPVALLACAELNLPPKPNLLHRVFHRRQKNTPVVRVYHESDFGLLIPDRADRWRLDEARLLGLHVPPRFCATVLPPASKATRIEAAASAAQK